MTSSTDSEREPRPIIVIMGVTGSGKTTIGQQVARRLRLPFYDADDFHTPENEAKLSQDIPLTDGDRQPWLEAIAKSMGRWQKHGGAILACSALKQAYRDTLKAAAHTVKFIYLEGDMQTVSRRLARRANREKHVVKNYRAILQGQFDDLEVPEEALAVSIDQPPDQVVDEILMAVEP